MGTTEPISPMLGPQWGEGTTWQGSTAPTLPMEGAWWGEGAPRVMGPQHPRHLGWMLTHAPFMGTVAPTAPVSPSLAVTPCLLPWGLGQEFAGTEPGTGMAAAAVSCLPHASVSPSPSSGPTIGKQR